MNPGARPMIALTLPIGLRYCIEERSLASSHPRAVFTKAPRFARPRAPASGGWGCNIPLRAAAGTRLRRVGLQHPASRGRGHPPPAGANPQVVELTGIEPAASAL